MKRVVTALALLVSLTASVCILGDALAEESDHYCLLRITSAKPGTECEFQGYYISQSRLFAAKTVMGRTPSEVRIYSDVAAAMFRGLDGGLQIQLLRVDSGKERLTSSGTGTRLLIEMGVTDGKDTIRHF